MAKHHHFPELKGFGRIDATCETDGTVTSETRFVALSWLPTPEVLLTTVRAHLAIESALHCRLAVSLREGLGLHHSSAQVGMTRSLAGSQGFTAA